MTRGMGAHRTTAASWAETGRYSPPPKRERLRDLAEASACIRAARPLPPLLAAWLANAFDELADQLAAGGRPNLHRMLGLPDRSWAQGRRRLFLRERNLSIRAIAAAMPAELTPWARAAALADLFADPEASGPEAMRGELAHLRAGSLGDLPSTPRTFYRILTR